MTTRREKLLQKLNPNLLKMTPKLSGDTGSFIDLNSNDSSLEDGARKLMMRFLRNQDLCDKFKRRSQQTDVEIMISSAKYNESEEVCELIAEKLTIPLAGDHNDEAEAEKPGRKLQKLKMELQDKMSAKWEEEYKKRLSENRNHKGCKESKVKDKKKNLSEEEDSDEESDEEGLPQAKGDKFLDNEAEVSKDLIDDEENCDFDADVEDEASEADSDVEEDDRSEDVENGKRSNCNKENEFDAADCSLFPAYQPGGGLLYGGSELTQYEEDLPQNLFSPSLKLSVLESPAPKFQGFNETGFKNKDETGVEEMDNSFLVKTKLFSHSQNANDSFDLSDVFDLCSGKFPDAEGSRGESATQASVRQESVACDENDCEDTLGDKSDSNSENEGDEDLKSQKDLPKQRKNIITFEESEPDDNGEVSESEEPHLPGPKVLSDDDEDDTLVPKSEKKKTRKSLHFSDEEDELNRNIKSQSEESDDDEEAAAANSDFDQKSVHYDSEENEIINPKEFFEREAELSGSEWSGDEDERGLDEFDKEDGDADNIDDDQVRSQLGKIHIRRVLDDDAREVRLIQEILFEDGDLHSDGKRRDRKFKWKNLGTFDDKGNEGESKADGGNSSEEDCAEEDQLRRLRHEKELFLMEKKKNGDVSSDDEILEENFQAVKVTSVKSSLKLSVSSEVSKLNKSLALSNARGSFLTRNEEFLSRLAKATSGVTDNVLGPKNSKNFVFATKSPEKTNPERSAVCKRQVEESENCRRREKRMKVMPPEIDTGPSILDLFV